MEMIEENKYLLGIDTSTSNMTIALLKNGEVVQEHDTEAVRNHSVQLLPNIQTLLKSAGIKPKDLSAIAVGQGPGSYTGVRIGVTAGKTFAWSLGIPLIGVSSLEAMAHSGINQFAGKAANDVEADIQPIRYIIPLMDARRNQVFTAIYEVREGGVWSCLKQDGIRLMSTWLEELADLLKDLVSEGLPKEIIFVGETEQFAEQINRFAEQQNRPQVIRFESSIKAAEVGLLANKQWSDPVFQADNSYDFVPNYTRLAEAEANLLKARQDQK
jgi:tRNA threonylcarbamoyladenosine biosynthesis protein TsaB